MGSFDCGQLLSVFLCLQLVALSAWSLFLWMLPLSMCTQYFKSKLILSKSPQRVKNGASGEMGLAMSSCRTQQVLFAEAQLPMLCAQDKKHLRRFYTPYEVRASGAPSSIFVPFR
jgi:hypothetical protein